MVADKADRWFVKTIGASAGAGVLFGLFSFLLIRLLHDAIVAADSLGLTHGWRRSPAVLVGLCSIVCGLVVAWLAERVSGRSGLILGVPVAVTALVGAVLAAVLCAWALAPLPALTYVFIVEAGIVLWITALFRGWQSTF